ncbi:hypothetical protein P8X24_08295 [Pyrococcus kukulkanii]|uniref:hypothetical protein n=1 Tax=Pyrococcus kukulkanii TaxID=1609559 RepID=UPI0035648DC0
MKKRALLIIILMITTTLATAEDRQELPARIYPAPVGYTVQFDTGEEIGQIYGIRTKTGDYLEHKAPPNTKTLWLPKITILDAIITKTATITLRPLHQPEPQALTLRLDKKTVLLLTTAYGQNQHNRLLHTQKLPAQRPHHTPELCREKSKQ